MEQTDREQASMRGLTPQRKVVLDVIQSSTEHLTAAEIFEQARQKLPTISYATVYNSLRHLKQTGLVAEVNFGSGASRYDRETSRHDHAVCTSCGKFVDFDLPQTVDLTYVAARHTRFHPETIHLTLYGVCPDCRVKT